MRVTQEPINIIDVLKDRTFSVPLYQREYSWGLEQVSDLYYDIEESDKEGHFLGALLIYSEDSNVKSVEIVDGQQRTTTLFLLLLSILKILKSSGANEAASKLQDLVFVIDPSDLMNEKIYDEPRLQLGKRDRRLFNALVTGENFEAYKDGRIKSHKNLLNAIDFFQKKLDHLKEQEGVVGVKEFAQKVINSKFILMTAEKQADKILLFKTVNARGLELTQGDLIKNELCHRLADDELDSAIETWDEIRGAIEKNGGKLDTFLYHYINSLDHIQEVRRELDKQRQIKNWNKNNYPPVSEKYLYDVYSKVIKETPVNDFLSGLKKACEIYIGFLSPKNSDIYLNSLKAMGVTKCFPLLLDVAIKFSKKEFIEFTRLIDALTFRHSILRNDPKELEKFYYQLSHDIVSSTQYEDSIERIKSHSNFKNPQFKYEFINATPKIGVSRMILDRIVRSNDISIDWSNKDSHIEHIMPKSPDNQWLDLFNEDKDKYRDYVNRLGNLTVLQDKKNIRARNKSFESKKEYYKTSSLDITTMLDSYEEWGYKEIEQRQEYLYELGKDLWS